MLLTDQVRQVVVVRCGRCEAILTDTDLAAEQKMDTLRCLDCNPWAGEPVGNFVLPAPTSLEAGDEWVRRIRLIEYNHNLVVPYSCREDRGQAPLEHGFYSATRKCGIAGCEFATISRDAYWAHRVEVHES